MDDTTASLLKLLDPPGDYLYHYTDLGAVIEHILPSGRIKMNPFSKMRDPRESKDLNPVGAAGPSGSTLKRTRRFFEIHDKSRWVKDQVKALSLTRDDPSERSEETAIFGRGFAHPRLWEKYGDNHRGICLCFDRDKLTRLLTKELSKHGDPVHGPVVYRDGVIKPEGYTVSLDEIDSYSDEEVIDRLIVAGMDELFFTKVTDWESEAEYRFVVPTKGMEPLYVPVRPALRAVMLGELASEHYTPSVVTLLEQSGVKELDIKILRVKWQDGGPFLRDPTAPGYS